MDESVRALLAATRLRVLADSFVLARLPAAAYPALLGSLAQVAARGFFSLVRSAEETTLLAAEASWAEMADTWPDAAVEAGWRLITLEQTIALDVVGYLAPLAQALAASGVPLLVVSAFSTDHLLIREQHLPVALAALQQVIDDATRTMEG